MTREGDYQRPSPAEFLRRIEAEQRHARQGRLKVFLGYASGVGKSFRMLDEGRRRKARGEDVVLVAWQRSASPEVAALQQNFETIQPRDQSGGLAIDVPGVLARRPEVALVDGLAYDNPPGSKHPHRWQDIEEILAAGISVVTSVNLQYVKERQVQVELIRGKSVRETVPESFLRTADEIEVFDAPPEYPVARLSQGAGRSEADVARFERELSELREIALLLTAEIVDHQLGEYLRRANRVGATATAFVTLAFAVTKFSEGAWIIVPCWSPSSSASIVTTASWPPSFRSTSTERPRACGGTG